MKKMLSMILAMVFVFEVPLPTHAAELTYNRNENSSVQVTEDATSRTAIEHNNGVKYVAVYDKQTKIITQNAYDEKTNALVDTTVCDLSKAADHGNENYHRFTCSGFGYDETSTEIFCQGSGNRTKWILIGIADQSVIDRGRSFEEAVEDISRREGGILAGIIGIVVAIVMPGGTVAASVTKSMFASVGITEAFYEACFDYHHVARIAEIRYSGI